MKKNNLNHFIKSNKNFYKIFLFHGVIRKNKYVIRNYTNKHILEKNFFNKIKFIKKNYNILSLEKIFFLIKKKLPLPDNTCAITFDDGFENNYSVAAPILKRYKIPTTFYFSTDFINNNSMSWIDKIEYVFEKTKKKTLILPWNNNSRQINNNQKKKLILDEIRKVLKRKNKNSIIENFVKDVFKQLDVKKILSLNSEIDKKINWSKVRKLNNCNLFTIGGHSHRHISLTSVPIGEAKIEIDKSLKFFKKKIGINLKHYSYPEGQEKDFNISIKKYLKKKGIIICPAAISGYNSINSNFFNLKRISISA